jgi:hypothetical protein
MSGATILTPARTSSSQRGGLAPSASRFRFNTYLFRIMMDAFGWRERRSGSDDPFHRARPPILQRRSIDFDDVPYHIEIAYRDGFQRGRPEPS